MKLTTYIRHHLPGDILLLILVAGLVYAPVHYFHAVAGEPDTTTHVTANR